jgi:hypothetical protein
VRELLQTMIESELEAVLARPRYARRPKADPENAWRGLHRRTTPGSFGFQHPETTPPLIPTTLRAAPAVHAETTTKSSPSIALPTTLTPLLLSANFRSRRAEPGSRNIGVGVDADGRRDECGWRFAEFGRKAQHLDLSVHRMQRADKP